MITHNTVSQEAKKIKEILDEGDLIIPGFYKCFWPCLAFVIWMVVWPFIAFCVFGDLQDEAFLLMGFLGFFGFGMSLIIFNARSCLVPDHHIDPRRTALFMARWLLRGIAEGKIS